MTKSLPRADESDHCPLASLRVEEKGSLRFKGAVLGRAGPCWAVLGRAGPCWAVLGSAGQCWLPQCISRITLCHSLREWSDWQTSAETVEVTMCFVLRPGVSHLVRQGCEVFILSMFSGG